MELFYTPASKLDTFVAKCLHPHKECKEEVLEAVRTVKKFLWQQCFPGKNVQVLEVGSFGNGTVLRDSTEVELVAFLSCFRSFRETEDLDNMLDQLSKTLCSCQSLLAFDLKDVWLVEEVFRAIAFTIWTKNLEKPITFTIMPAYRDLVPHGGPSAEVYVDLIEARKPPGNFSPSFAKLQRSFVKHRPAKLKSLLRLVKHWYLKYVKARCPIAKLPPLYALELLTIYAWEVGTKAHERFHLDRGLVTVMCLLQEYQSLCIYWTNYYKFQNPIIEDFVREQLKKERSGLSSHLSQKALEYKGQVLIMDLAFKACGYPKQLKPIILDPADPTYNVAYGYRWDIVSQRARQCLKQRCCHNNKSPVPPWYIKPSHYTACFRVSAKGYD